MCFACRCPIFRTDLNRRRAVITGRRFGLNQTREDQKGRPLGEKKMFAISLKDIRSHRHKQRYWPPTKQLGLKAPRPGLKLEPTWTQNISRPKPAGRTKAIRPPEKCHRQAVLDQLRHHLRSRRCWSIRAGRRASCPARLSDCFRQNA